MARVRVVMPVYNRASTVLAALDSILRQTFSDFDVIIADDGSSDSTSAVVAQFAADDSRFRLLRLSHEGVAAARNAAIDEAGDHEYVAFLDSDDVWQPAHLARALSAFERIPDAGVYFARVEVEDLGAAWSRDRLENHLVDVGKPIALASGIVDSQFHFLTSETCRSAFIFSEFSPQTPSVVVRKGAVRRTPWFRPELQVLEDCEMFLSMALDGVHFVFDNEVHVNVRRLGDNLSGIPDVLSERAMPRLKSVLKYHKEKLLSCRSSRERSFVMKEVADTAYLLGQNFGERLELDNARTAYLDSMRHRMSYPAVKGIVTSMLPLPAFRFLKTRRNYRRGPDNS